MGFCSLSKPPRIARRSFKLPVHGGGVGLAGGIAHARDLDLEAALAEGDFYYVPFLYLIAGLYGLAVHAHALTVAGVVCDSAPLYQAGNLEVFIQSH